MKKTLLLILFLFVFTVSAQAAERFYYDGKWNLYTANPISVYYLDEKVNFDVPPMIIADRTLVPARILFEKMGADVSWNEKNRQVTVQNEEFQINIKIDSQTCYVNEERYTLDVPAKIITDSNGTARTLVPLRFISEALGFDVTWNEAEYKITINEKTSKPPKEEHNNTDYNITSIKCYESGSTDIIDIYTDNENPEIFELNNPYRIVLDFKDTKNGLSGTATGNKGRFYSNIRYSYRDNSYTRIVVDASCTSYSTSYVNNCVRISLEGKISKLFEYSSLDVIKITIPDISSAQIISAENNTYTFKLNKAFDEDMSIDANDTYIKSISLKQDLLEVLTNTPMNFTISPKSGYTEVLAERPKLQIKSDIKLKESAGELTVVIDPGHGGKDPGAVGKENGKADLYEKDLNLDISNMVNEILVNSGYTAIMTRTTDVYLELSERAEIANKNRADIFVCIHNNSYTTPSVNGSQVYYYASEGQVDNVFSGKMLATFIQDELVSALKTTDRGISNGSRYYVIKNTDMPAVIVEGAFITNEGDKAILKSYSGRLNMAKAIADGIIKALNYIAES